MPADKALEIIVFLLNRSPLNPAEVVAANVAIESLKLAIADKPAH